MALQFAAVMAALAVAEKFLDIPIVKRMLSNMAKQSANKIDDFIIAVLYATEEKELPAKLAEAQKTYDEVAPDTREKMKNEPSVIPVDKPEVQAKLREVMGDSYPFPPMP